MFSANVQCKKIADIMQYFRIEDFFECGVRGGEASLTRRVLKL